MVTTVQRYQKPTGQHPADCALCPGEPGTTHVYIDAAAMARRVEAAKATNARIRAAIEAAKR